MRSLAVVSVLAVLLSAVVGVQIEQHIVNGIDLAVETYQFMGSYRNFRGEHQCGAVYIGSTYALTAASCAGASSWSVGFGNSNKEQVTPYSLRNVLVHPNYGSGPGYQANDFELLVTVDAPMDDGIFAGIVSSRTATPSGTAAIMGWGRTCPSCALPDTLKGLHSMPILSDGDCFNMWGADVDSQMHVCAFNGGNSGICYGDAGGPMAIGAEIYGIASWHEPACSPGLPSVYGKVGAVYNWVCSASGHEANGC